MPHLFKYILRKMGNSISALSWKTVIAMYVTLLLVCWAGYYIFEPENDISKPENILWFFNVTATTVGYGDMSPTTFWGRFIAVYINMYGGISFVSLIMAKIGTDIFNFIRRRKMGLHNYSHFENHIVVIGNMNPSVRNIIRQLVSDNKDKQNIVLVAGNIDENPYDNIQFVKAGAEDFSNVDTLDRAGIANARTIIVRPETDDQAIAISLACYHKMSHRENGWNMVVSVQENSSSHLIHNINDNIEVVRAIAPSLMASAAKDPGISAIQEVLLDPEEGQTSYSIPYSKIGQEGDQFGRVATWFMANHNAILIGYSIPGQSRPMINPGKDTIIPMDAVVWYIAEKRLGA